ncbi:hypothetical protein ACLKA7_008390 [Drosophila subpalustris]
MAVKNSYKRPSDFIDPGEPSKCTWHLGTKEQTLHTQRGIAHPQKITPNILEAIGCTPLVRLNNIPAKEGIQCEMYDKCEFMNPERHLSTQHITTWHSSCSVKRPTRLF